MSAEADDTPLPAHKSLRARGFLATLALLAYIVGAGLYISHERGKIYESIQALEQIARHEKALALAEAAVNGALVDVSEASSAGGTGLASPAELRLYMESCSRLFGALEEFDPSYALLQRAIARSYDTLAAAPLRANWIDLREALHRASDDLEIRHRTIADRRDALTAAYQRRYDAVTVESFALATAGIVAFGTFAAWFFVRLARDVRRLEEHARRIVHGARGVALPVGREDELGRLMHAVNRMADDLDEREKQIELEGQRRSHQDKMLAVGALAAGVAHEVNNPLAVIAGVAQELMSAGAAPASQLAEGAQAILAQVQRASQAARQLADAAALQPAELDWIDLNAQVRRVVQLLGYDRRYRQFVFDFVRDPALPAVRTSANAIQQLLLQLLTLCCDAIAARPGAPAVVRIVTGSADRQIEVEFGFGPVLDFTRPEVQRSLLLCRAIVEPLRGRLAFGQAEGPMLRIKLTLPADGGGAEE